MAPKAKRKSSGKTTPVRPQRVLVIDAGEPFRQVGATLREDQIVALDQVRARTGLPATEQIRRAVDLWLASQ